MPYCQNHPDRETRYQCRKYNVYLCEECLACRDPALYCKFRSSCIIWMIHKERRRSEQNGEETRN